MTWARSYVAQGNIKGELADLLNPAFLAILAVLLIGVWLFARKK